MRLSVEKLKEPGQDRDLIYHYTSTRTAIERILYSRDLLFNSLSRTHDPLEFEDYSTYSGGANDRSTNYLVERAFMISKINHIFKYATKIACFSADGSPRVDYTSGTLFTKGFCRSRMWSQYSDAHKGVCIVFDRNDFVEAINDFIKTIAIGEGTTINLDTNYITYDNKLPGLAEALSEDPNILNEISVMELVEENLRTYLFLKLEDYEHEQEFRICLYSASFKESDGVHIKYNNSLKGVILGCRFPEQYMINIKEQAVVQDFPVFRIYWTNGVPDLVEIALD